MLILQQLNIQTDKGVQTPAGFDRYFIEQGRSSHIDLTLFLFN